MKTETNSRNGHGKKVQTHQENRNGNTALIKFNCPTDIAERYEATAKETGVPFQELMAETTRLHVESKTAPKPERFLNWLEEIPDRPEGKGPRYVTLKVDVDLTPEDWTSLAMLAQLNNETIGEPIDNLLEDALMDLQNGQEVAVVTLTPEVVQ